MNVKFTNSQLEQINNGEIVRALNGKRYVICGDCGKLVCLDKFFFSSMHVCD